MNDLKQFVDKAGFKSISVKPNMISEEYSLNPGGWVLTALK
jgi:hypothetical protein